MKLLSALKIISLASFVNSTTIGGEYLNDRCQIASSGEVVCKDDEVTNGKGEGVINPNCMDNHELCSEWASAGECSKNPNYMRPNCMKSCNTCPIETGGNNTEVGALMNAIKEFGVAQTVSGDRRKDTLANVRETVSYMKNVVHAENPTHKMTKEVIKSCKNNEALCSYWAVIGECDANQSYMTTKCAPSCKSCEKIDINVRCGDRDPEAVPGLRPGDLNSMFERIVATAPGNQTDETQIAAQEKKVQDNGTPFYTVHIHSSPSSSFADSDDKDTTPLSRERDLKEDVWVITMDNFLTDEESDYLINFGYKNKYERSRDVGKKLFDGSFDSQESTRRTSANSWCDAKSGCRTDPVVQRIAARLSNVTQIPTPNFEDFQMLKYEVGQFYRKHHDYIGHQRDRHCGPRILTFFLYLSDVEAGGGTGFPDLDMVVQPKKGRALLWPSILNSDPSNQDSRTMHEARSVEAGTKFAANAWIHLYDYINNHQKGCV